MPLNTQDDRMTASGMKSHLAYVPLIHARMPVR
jgi:hypothetical protein